MPRDSSLLQKLYSKKEREDNTLVLQVTRVTAEAGWTLMASYFFLRLRILLGFMFLFPVSCDRK